MPDPKLRKKYQQWEKQHRHTGLSTLGQTAAMTAYATGDEWLRDLLAVVEKNYQLLRGRLAENIPEIKISELQGTYLAWLDIRNWLPKLYEIKHYIQDQAGLAIEAAVKRLIEVDRSIKGGITDELSNSNRISADRQSQ